MATLDLSEITSRLDAGNAKLDASSHRYDFDALINVWSKPR